MKKFLFGLAPLLALAAFAMVPSAASALVQCDVLTSAVGLNPGIECHNPPGVTNPQNLRDFFTVVEEFGTDGLAVNTAGPVRFSATIKSTKEVITNESPAGYALFGVKLIKNPPAPVTAEEKTKCEVPYKEKGKAVTVKAEAIGTVPWLDIQNGKPSAVFNDSKVWELSVRSDLCKEKGGEVRVENVALLFETLGTGSTSVTAAGKFVGKYSEPSSLKCPGGGVELEIAQPGITTSPLVTEKPEIDDGEANKPAFICFVSSNNYLFPKTAPTWAPFTNSAGTKEPGIWKN